MSQTRLIILLFSDVSNLSVIYFIFKSVMYCCGPLVCCIAGGTGSCRRRRGASEDRPGLDAAESPCPLRSASSADARSRRKGEVLRERGRGGGVRLIGTPSLIWPKTDLFRAACLVLGFVTGVVILWNVHCRFN